MYELLSVTVGLTFWAIVGWGAYRTYRVVASRVPALDHAVNTRIRAARDTLTSRQGDTSLRVAYLWTLGNHHARYRHATNEQQPATSEGSRYLDAA